MEREATWKREDIEKWKAVGAAKRVEEEKQLEPKRGQKAALRKELDLIREKIRKMQEEENKAEQDLGSCDC